MDIYSPSFLREFLRGLPLRSKLGQRFLVDRNIVKKIIEESCIKKGEAVLEIGAGIGTLTLPLAMKGARVYAIEKDKRLEEKLIYILRDYPVKVLHNDILSMNIYSILRKEKKWKVISNPPYSIVSPIFFKLLEYPSKFDFFLFILQKEVADKLIFKPNIKDDSLLTLKVKLYCDAKILRRIPKQVFFPPPKVDSSLVKIDIKRKRKISNEDSIIRTGKMIFQERRKMLKNVLPLPISLYNSLGISPEWRGEVLSIEQLIELSKALKKLRK